MCLQSSTDCNNHLNFCQNICDFNRFYAVALLVTLLVALLASLLVYLLVSNSGDLVGSLLLVSLPVYLLVWLYSDSHPNR